ncbi:MAG TPA: S9 family peptidase [Gemmatimonadales bacterium]
MRLANLAIAAVVAVTLAPPLPAQGDPGILTLDRIGRGEFRAQEYGPIRWTAGGASYTVLEPSASVKEAEDLVQYDVASGRRSVLIPANRLIPPGDSVPISIEDFAWSPAGPALLIYTNSRRVWRQNTRGDYWLVDTTSWSLHKLGPGAKPSTLMFATFSPDGRRVAYVRERNVYVETVADGQVTQLTSDGSPTVVNGTFDWVYEEELNLRNGFRWSPDGARIAYWQLNMDSVRNFDLINDTDSLYSFVVPVQYPKAGTSNSAAHIGVVAATGGPTKWLDIPGNPRNQYLARMSWAASPRELVIQRINRLQDTNDVMLGDAETGAVHTVLTERDSAWLDVVDDLKWLDGGKSFLWVSERDGWRHLYRVSRDGKSVRLLTPGSFDLISPEAAFGAGYVHAVDTTAGWAYFSASPDNATQRYLFRARLDGKGRPERLTPAGQSGSHDYDIAPGARWALHTWSAFDKPPTIELTRLPKHETIRVLVDNAELVKRLATLRTRPVEFFQAPTDDGTKLDGWLLKPVDFDSTKRYPVLFHVYGEPASQTVLDEWGGFLALWHRMLVQQGYIIASVDNRGTPAPRGRAWRKSIYRQIGVLASADQAAAARYLAGRAYVDPARIGIWGWSGGGSMSLNAIFRYPDVYDMAMSVAPVPDLRLYDTIYQERYMGLPAENAEAYRIGSPITFADRLRGRLLVVHGSGDDNVHFQGTERLVNALVAANKQFTMMDYPNRSHCICEGQGTTRHLFELLEGYLHNNLPLAISR